MKTDKENTVPEGYRENALGHLVLIKNIKEIDLIRDELVKNIAKKGAELQKSLAEYKAWSMAEVAAFVELSALEYGVELGGKKGNVTLISFDGNTRLSRNIAETKFFDERIQAAKKLFDDCMKRKAEKGIDPLLQQMLEGAFQVNKQGHINVNEVAKLNKYDCEDDDWQLALKAANDAIQVSGTKPFVRIHKRNNDEFKLLSLDIAKL